MRNRDSRTSTLNNIANCRGVEADSVVERAIKERVLSITPAHRSFADRLAASPKSSARWHLDAASLEDGPVGRELL